MCDKNAQKLPDGHCPSIFSCETCDYTTSDKPNYNKHMQSKKHVLFLQQKCIKLPGYKCTLCNFNSNNKSNYIIHKKRTRHLNNCEITKVSMFKKLPEMKFLLEKHTVDEDTMLELLDKHKENENENNNNNMCSVLQAHLLNESIKTDELHELKKDLYDFQKTVLENAIRSNETQTEIKNAVIELTKKEQLVTVYNNNNSITNNTNNTQFNLNVFLNEKCKDAINLTEFVESIQVSTDDVEYVGKHGFVEGITKIIREQLQQLGTYHRPIHCTDIKREVIHIRNNDKWEKDIDGNKQTQKAIQTIADKNLKTVSRWQRENPEYMVLDSEEYKLWMNIVRNSNNAGTQEEKNEAEVLRKVANIVALSKIRYEESGQLEGSTDAVQKCGK